MILSEKTFETLNNNYYLASGIIKGNVSDDRGNMQGVTVLLEGSISQTKATDASGNYRFTNLPAGDYTLSFSSIGYSKITHQVILAEGQERTVDVSLLAEEKTI
jgi:iron complex outermembrane receptor protein